MNGVLPCPRPLPPFEVDPVAVDDVAQHVLDTAVILDDLATFVAGGAYRSGLQGRAADRYATTLPGLWRQAASSSLALRDVARAVFGHADALADLQRRHAALVDWRRRLLDFPIHLARLAADDVTGTAVPGALVAARAELASYDAALARWSADLASAEDEVVAVLRRAMDTERVERRYAGVPDVPGERPPGHGASPAAVAAWWRRLTPAQRWSMIAAFPEVIGNLDGVPARARDRANRAVLDRDLGELGKIPAGARSKEERTRYANAAAARDALDRIGATTDPWTGGRPTIQLYAYAPDAFGGDGAVAIVVGDLDHASNVAVTVPGFGTDMGSASLQVDKPINLYEAARFEHPGATTAAMTWIGYDVPDLPDGTGDADAAGVVAEKMAAAGGGRLADTLDGIDAMRGGDDRVHLTVIGYSYGSTTLGHALHDQLPGADDAALVGSPGVGDGVDRSADLHVPVGHVWVGANSRDPITELGDTGAFGLGSIDGSGLGRNPAEDAFGAHRFHAEDVTRGADTSLRQHSRYFAPNTESLSNLAHIVTGDYGAVTTAPGVHDGAVRLRDVWDGATRAADGVDHLGHAVTHPWDLGSDAASAGKDLLEIGRDAEGRPDDPEWSHDPATPATDPSAP